VSNVIVAVIVVAGMLVLFERARPLFLILLEPKRLPAAPPPNTAIPSDLASLALQQSEAWAQEESLKAMRELYADVGDWNLVRMKFGVAPPPETVA